MNLRCPYCMGLLPSGGGACPDCGQDPETYTTAANQLPPGTILRERYYLGRALGAGGFGITYLGWDETLARRVAIKEYYPRFLVWRDSVSSLKVSCHTDTDAPIYQKGRQSFLKEARTLSKMGTIREIVQVYDFFEAYNTAYLVMEYLEGKTFQQIVKERGPLSMQELLTLLKPIFRALEAVHNAGIIHRDISPDNLIFQHDGTVKIMDFGCAREIDSERTMTAMLKHSYAPPEQYTGRNQGTWTDIYAFCAMIYYCLTGQAPPRSLERYEDNDPLQPPRSLGAAITPEQEAALLKGMAIRPERRWQSVSELYAALYSADTAPGQPESTNTPANVASDILTGGTASSPGETVCLTDDGEAANHTEAPDGGETPDNAETPEGRKPLVDVRKWMDFWKHGVKRKAVIIGASIAAVVLLAALSAYFHWNGQRWRDNILMEDGEFGKNPIYEDCPAFASEISRKQVYTLTFLNSTRKAPADAWDVSREKNRSVLAWAEKADISEAADSEGNANPAQAADLYHLYIAGNGGIAAPADCGNVFRGYCRAVQIHMNGLFHTENVSNMSNMFSGCGSLKALDVSGFDTSHVANLSGMFDGCGSLKALDVSGFDTSHVTDMSFMFGDSKFGGCGSLETLDVSGFDTSRVTDMHCMFFQCGSLKTLDVSGFDTSHVTNMRSMFNECGSLETLDVSGFDTSCVTDMGRMFRDCGSLETLDVSGFDTSHVTDMWEMFRGCKNLKTIYASEQFMTDKVSNGTDCFYGCTSLKGGNGTAYRKDRTGTAYARMDTPGTPGYFSAKSMPLS